MGWRLTTYMASVAVGGVAAFFLGGALSGLSLRSFEFQTVAKLNNKAVDESQRDGAILRALRADDEVKREQLRFRDLDARFQNATDLFNKLNNETNRISSPDHQIARLKERLRRVQNMGLVSAEELSLRAAIAREEEQARQSITAYSKQIVALVPSAAARESDTQLGIGRESAHVEAYRQLRQITSSSEKRLQTARSEADKVYRELFREERMLSLANRASDNDRDTSFGPQLRRLLERLAQPARVEFSIASRMSIGERYEVRMAVGPPGQNGSLVTTTPGSTRQSTDVHILDRVRGLLQSAHFKIERLSDEWQQVTMHAPAVWIWRLEPLDSGEKNVLVTIQHIATVDEKDHQITLRHFPQQVIVDVGWWHRAQLVFSGLPPAAQGAAALVTAIGAVGTVIWAGWVKWRKRGNKTATRHRPRSKGKVRTQTSL